MAALKDPRQEKFCQLMAAGGKTQEQAAIEAGYSERSARQQAARLLTNDNICDRMNELRGIQEEEVADELRRLKDFWLDVMEDEEERMNDRLKASEL